jgi:hypothetical protein
MEGTGVVLSCELCFLNSLNDDCVSAFEPAVFLWFKPYDYHQLSGVFWAKTGQGTRKNCHTSVVCGADLVLTSQGSQAQSLPRPPFFQILSVRLTLQTAGSLGSVEPARNRPGRQAGRTQAWVAATSKCAPPIPLVAVKRHGHAPLGLSA